MIDELAYDQSIQDRYGCRFGGRKNTAVNATQNDDWHQQSPDSVFKRYPEIFQGEFVDLDLTLVFDAIDDGVDGHAAG